MKSNHYKIIMFNFIPQQLNLKLFDSNKSAKQFIITGNNTDLIF
jgi:hypothetical protein